MPQIRRRIRIEGGIPTDDVLDYKYELLEDWDFFAVVEPRLYAATAWVGPTEIETLPNPINILVENTSGSDNIWFYFAYLSSAYKIIRPGESCLWTNLAWGSGASAWRILGKGAGLVGCKVTMWGNY